MKLSLFLLILNFVTTWAPLPPIETCDERKDRDSCVDNCECRWCISGDYCYDRQDESRCDHHSHTLDKCKNTRFYMMDNMIPSFSIILVILVFLCMLVLLGLFLCNYVKSCCLYLSAYRRYAERHHEDKDIQEERQNLIDPEM